MIKMYDVTVFSLSLSLDGVPCIHLDIPLQLQTPGHDHFRRLVSLRGTAPKPAVCLFERNRPSLTAQAPPRRIGPSRIGAGIEEQKERATPPGRSVNNSSGKPGGTGLCSFELGHSVCGRGRGSPAGLVKSGVKVGCCRTVLWKSHVQQPVNERNKKERREEKRRKDKMRLRKKKKRREQVNIFKRDTCTMRPKRIDTVS